MRGIGVVHPKAIVLRRIIHNILPLWSISAIEGFIIRGWLQNCNRNKDADWKNSKDAIQRGMQKLKGGYPADPVYQQKK